MAATSKQIYGFFFFSYCLYTNVEDKNHFHAFSIIKLAKNLPTPDYRLNSVYESMSKFVKILFFSIFYENHLSDRDLNFFI